MKDINENRKGYKKTSIGWIPEDWKVVKIKDIGSISSGTTPFRGNKEYFLNGDTFWVKTTDLNNSYILNTEEMITEKALKETSLKIYPIDTVLVAMYGGFNQIGRTGLLKIKATINQALSAITVNKNIVNPLFLMYWFNAKIGLWKNFAGSSRKDPNINSKDVYDFPFLLLNINSQNTIANIFRDWDNAIEKTQKLIELKEKRKKSLMQKLLSGKKRVKGYKDKIGFSILKNYLREVSIRNENYKVNNVLSVTNTKGFINQTDQFDKSVASLDLSNYKIIKKGQFAYNPSRVNVGSIDLLSSFEVGILSPMYVVFETDKERLLPQYLYFHLKSYWFLGHIPMYVQGSVRDSLSFDGLCAMKFFIRSIEEQQEIADILNCADKEVKLLKQKLESLKRQKKGLMQVLLTGKIRVKNDTNGKQS